MNELFKNISWTQYLLFAGAVTVLYYLAIGVFYFRKSFRLPGPKSSAVPRQQEQLDDSPSGELMDELEKTVNEIGHSILVPGNKATHDELLMQLKVSVANFGGLSRPGYRYALNNYIITKAKENCGTDFSEEELDDTWDSLSR